MNLLSTFDPKFRNKTIREVKEQFGSDNIIVIRKSKYFLWIKALIPFLFYTVSLILIIVLLFRYIHTPWFLILLIGVLVGFRISLNTKTVKNFIDYKMDFIIVTPRAFIRYDQEGFFKKISKTIDLKKIRSISVRKRGIRNSLFNNGTLLVLSEGGESEQNEKLKAGEIVFRYLYNPEYYDERINNLLSKVFTNKN